MNRWNRIKESIDKYDDILLFTHVYADGDAIGSACALAGILKFMGKKVSIILEEKPEAKLSFMTDAAARLGIECDIYSHEQTTAQISISGRTVAIAVDTSDAARIATRIELFNACAASACIDHHDTEQDYTDVCVRDASWAATAEGIWQFAEYLGVFDSMPADYQQYVATSLYVGLLTDTGGFAFSNVTALTYLTAARIYDYVESPSEIYTKLFKAVTRNELELKAELYKRIEYYAGGKIAFAELDKKILAQTGTSLENTEGFASVMRDIENVSVSILVKPGKRDEEKRLSLRSNADCDVAEVAALFGGGGHKRAAGITFIPGDKYESFGEFKQILIEKIIGVVEN